MIDPKVQYVFWQNFVLLPNELHCFAAGDTPDGSTPQILTVCFGARMAGNNRIGKSIPPGTCENVVQVCIQ